jgi:hypothetical protein
MKTKDYIPKKDKDFDILQENVYTKASANMTVWLIQQQTIDAFDAPRQRWNDAYLAYCDPSRRTQGVTQEKIDARKEYETALRIFIQGQLMHNSRVSDANRRDMGLPVYDRIPTPASPPETRPEVNIDFSQIARHVLRVRDSGMKKAGKPPHIAGFEIWCHIGGHTEPTFEEMRLLGQATRSPHTLEYTSADRTQMAWYATRWVNTRGEKGPWSEFVSAIIA